MLFDPTSVLPTPTPSGPHSVPPVSLVWDLFRFRMEVRSSNTQTPLPWTYFTWHDALKVPPALDERASYFKTQETPALL